jgi:CBS-domain-containing membrane protein
MHLGEENYMGPGNNILRFLGIESHSTSHAEKAISAVGGFIGILLSMWISIYYVGAHGAALITASMGASAVLLYAAPHSPLAQPWPLVGGNVISALVGISCAQLISNPLLAAPLGVALAITSMHYLRCLHPPGGGTGGCNRGAGSACTRLSVRADPGIVECDRHAVRGHLGELWIQMAPLSCQLKIAAG